MTKQQPFPQDRGWSWVIVCGCFVASFVIMGIGKSSGLLLAEFQSRFHVPMSLASTTLAVSAAVFAPAAPTCILLGQTLTERRVMIVGGLIGFAGMSLASLLYSMEYVIITFGVCFGIGNAAVFGNCLVLLGYYFNKRRSLANGIALSGTSLGQFVMPPVIEFLLETFGLQGCLLLIGGIYLHVVAASSVFRPRSFWGPPSAIPQHAEAKSDERGEVNNVTGNGHLTDHAVSDVAGPPPPPLPSGTVARDRGSNGDVTSANGYLTADHAVCDVATPSPPSPHHSPPLGSPGDVATEDGGGSSNDDVIRDDAAARPESIIITRERSSAEEEAEANFSSNSSSECDDKDPSPKSPLIVTSPKEVGFVIRTGKDEEGEDEGVEGNGKGEGESLSPRVVRYRSFMTSTGSLCMRPLSLYSSSVLLEAHELQVDDDEDEKAEGGGKAQAEGFWKKLMAALFDFSVMRSYVAVFVVLVNLVSVLGYSTITMFLPPAVMERGVDKYGKAMLVSISGIGDLVGRLFVALIGDRKFVQRYRLQAIGVFGVSLNVAMLLLADSFAWMGVHCFLYGFFGGVYVSLMIVVVIDLVGLVNMPRVLAVMMLVQGIGTSVGHPILGAVSDVTGSFQWVIAICALSTLVGGLIFLCYPLVVKLEYRRPKRFRLLPQNKM